MIRSVLANLRWQCERCELGFLLAADILQRNVHHGERVQQNWHSECVVGGCGAVCADQQCRWDCLALFGHSAALQRCLQRAHRYK